MHLSYRASSRVNDAVQTACKRKFRKPFELDTGRECAFFQGGSGAEGWGCRSTIVIEQIRIFDCILRTELIYVAGSC